MKIDLKQLLPLNISDEAALHLVNFTRNLSLALESIYFDSMLHHTSTREQNLFDSDVENEQNPPF